MVWNKTRFRHRFMRFMATEGGLTFLLLSLIVFLFVLYPVVTYHRLPTSLLSISFSIVLIAAAVAAIENRKARNVVIGLGVSALVAHWGYVLMSYPASRIVADVLVLCFLGSMIVLLLSRVLRRGRVNYHRIGGAVAVYLLIGLLWTEAYGLVEYLIPGSFQVGGKEIGAEFFSGSTLYFSFVTLTTLGYGDITPQNIIVRQLCVLEAITGALFISTLIARLVSLEASHQGRKELPEEED